MASLKGEKPLSWSRALPQLRPAQEDAQVFWEQSLVTGKDKGVRVSVLRAIERWVRSIVRHRDASMVGRNTYL